MTAEVFYQRLKEILGSEYPDADLSFTVHLKNEELCYAVEERNGQLCFSMGQPVATVRAYDWSFTVFHDTIGRTHSCGSVRVHQKAVANLGPEFAERVGRQLLAIAARNFEP